MTNVTKCGRHFVKDEIDETKAVRFHAETLHHVIVRGIEKRDIVNDKYDRKRMVSRLGDLAKETKTSVYAWVLMSNLMHINLATK